MNPAEEDGNKGGSMEESRIKPPEISLDCPRSPEEREIRYKGYTEKLRQKEEA